MNLERGLWASDDDYTLNQAQWFSRKSGSNINFALLAIVVIGLCIRIGAASGGPWFDEIWSWEMAREGDVLVAHDNNHLLNTLWLWLMRDVSSTLAWRMPAVICGVISIWLTGIILRRLGREHAVCGAMMMAVCHPMVVYQSEARGYASMLLCVLVCIELQLRWFELPEKRRLIRLGLITAAMFGVLSHLSFGLFNVLLAISGYSLSRFDKKMLADHAVGIGFSGFWWIAFGRRMSIGGGNELGTLDVLTQSISDLIGCALTTNLLWIILAAACLIACAFAISKKSPRIAAILITITLGYPLLVLCMKDKLIYVRYFLPAILGAMLLMSAVLGQMLKDRRLSLAGVLILLFIVRGHSYQDAALLLDGRDKHAQAIARMLNHPHKQVSVGSPADFQLRSILSYYALKDGNQNSILAEKIDQCPEWLVIMHSPSPEVIVTGNCTYDRDSSYTAHSLSGIPWEIYHRRDTETADIDSGLK